MAKFGKGRSPWNKGKKFAYKPRFQNRGRIPWNKGLPSPQRGIPRTGEVKDKIRKALTGKKHTPERILKNKLSHLGKRVSMKTEFKKGMTPWNKGKKYLQISGDKHWSWKGGITKTSHKLRTSLEYTLWRRSVLQRDSFRCIWCGEDDPKLLEADHIKPFSLFPDLRFAIDNGRTLCRTCHRKKGLQKNIYKYKQYNHARQSSGDVDSFSWDNCVGIRTL